MVIASEGHRSRLGKILPAEKGMGLVVKLMEQNNSGLFLPLAIRYPKGRNYSLNFNPIIKTEVVVICGPLMEVKDVLEEVRKTIPQNRINFSTISHFLMWKLAQGLPESIREFIINL